VCKKFILKTLGQRIIYFVIVANTNHKTIEGYDSKQVILKKISRK
jgi:hypothetical protein